MEGINYHDHLLKIIEKIRHIQDGYRYNRTVKQMSDLVESMRQYPIIYSMEIDSVVRKFHTELKEEFVNAYILQTAIGIILPFSEFLEIDNYHNITLLDDTTYSNLMLTYYTRKEDFSNIQAFANRLLCIAFYYEIYSFERYDALYHFAVLHLLIVIIFSYFDAYNVYPRADTKLKQILYLPMALIGIRVRDCCNCAVLITLSLNIFYILFSSAIG